MSAPLFAVLLLSTSGDPVLAVSSSGEAAPASTPAPAEKPLSVLEYTQQISGAVITLPVGGYLRYDWTSHRQSGVRFGLFTTNAIFSEEIGLQLGWIADPPFFEAHLDLAAEPGVYLQLDDPEDETPAERTFGWRRIARGQINFNLRFGDWWIYSRTTGFGRYRDFVEHDEFRSIRIGNEYSIEQATAPIYRAGTAGKASFWIYAEHTVGAVDGVGVVPHRVSTGLITERWLLDGLSMNVDVFWSFEKNTGRGAGGIFAWWMSF